MIYYSEPDITLYHGDCEKVMQGLEPDSMDLVVTDPPYGYAFMGKNWDRAVPPVAVWKECLRVLKPGAFAFIMSAPRQDVLSRMIVNLQDAGFETGFTSIYWAYASGFPKAQNISLSIDKQACMRELTEKLGRKPTKEEFKEAWAGFREVVGKRTDRAATPRRDIRGGNLIEADSNIDLSNITAPATPEAQALDGSYGGFQPKPAVEIILVCMKPLSEKTFVGQALENGKGITWLDDGRIPFDVSNEGNLRLNSPNHTFSKDSSDFKLHKGEGTRASQDLGFHNSQGRFPANLLVSDDVLNDGRETTGVAGTRQNKQGETMNVYGKYGPIDSLGFADSGSFSRYFSLDAWFAEQLKELPPHVRQVFPFLLVPKASKGEKNEGCEELEEKDVQPAGLAGAIQAGNERPRMPRSNHHPTVKPLALMSYLTTIGSRPGDTVLDPYAGSGTLSLACKLISRKSIAIEREAEYCEIAKARIIGDGQGVLL